MTTLTSLARGLAVESGHAELIRTVRHVHLSDRPLVFIPLELAGEANAPLAALVGDDRDKPRLLTVCEPRNRTERFEFAADLAASVMLPYIDGYATAEPREKEAYPDAPQLLVPNLAGVKFTRLLGRSTRFRRTQGDWAVPVSVPLLGQWLSFYSQRTEHPVSSLLLPLTSVVAAHWATGQSATEDQNLAALLAWISPPPGKSALEAARDAENPVDWPPAGPATDPTFDQEVLEGLIQGIREATSAGGGAALARYRAALEAALASQLGPTWRLMWQAVDLLRSLPAGAHVAKRWESDRWAFTYQVAWIRDGGAPQAKRDSAVRAAQRLDRMEREQQQVAVQQAYDDPLVMAEYRMTGAAFEGQVVHAESDRVVGEGRSAKLRPLIVIETTDPVAVEPDAQVASPAFPSQRALVRDVAPVDDTRARVALELSGGMGRSKVAPAGSMPAVGDVVCYTSLIDEFQRAPEFPDPENTPWTHGGPPQERTENDDDANEAWS